MKNLAEIFDFRTGYLMVAGLESTTNNDEAFKIARRLARDRERSMVIKDHWTRAFYRVTPSGRKLPMPPEWGKKDWDDD